MKKYFYPFLSFFILLTLFSGCAVFNGNKTKEEKLKAKQYEQFINSIPQKETIITLWKKKLGDFEKFGFDIAIDNGNSYSINTKAQIQAINLQTGNQIWSKQIQKMTIAAAPGLDENHLYAVDTESNLIAISRDDGSIVWQKQVLGEVLTPPVSINGTVLVKTSDARLIAFEADTGVQTWVYRHQRPGLSLRGGSTPVAYGGQVIIGFDDGQLISIDVDSGQRVWSITVGKSTGLDEIQRLVDIDSQPILDNDTLYVSAYQRQLMALDLSIGKIKWRSPISSYKNITFDDRHIYLIQGKNNIVALDKDNGQFLWDQTKLTELDISSISLLGDNVLITDEKNGAFLLDPDNGEFLSREYLTNGPPIIQPKSSDGKAYILSVSGYLFALNLQE